MKNILQIDDEYVYITGDGLFCVYSHRLTGTINKFIFLMMCPANSSYSIPVYFPVRRYMTPISKNENNYFVSDDWIVLGV